MSEDGAGGGETEGVADRPSASQQQRLRRLALERGRSFVVPRTAAEAERSIEELEGVQPESGVERAVELKAVRGALGRAGDGASVRDGEIVGYGSSARWR